MPAAPKSMLRSHRRNPGASSTTTLSPFEELSALIPDNEWYPFLTMIKLTNMVEKRVNECYRTGSGCYLGISGVTEDMIDKMDTAFARREMRKQMRFWYDPGYQCLIMKMMPGVFPNCTYLTLAMDIIFYIRNIPGHSPYSYCHIGAATVQDPSGASKQGDYGITPATRSIHDFPSLMIEVGYSEYLPQLRCGAKWWLLSSSGATRMVILLHITSDPPSLGLESWTITQSTCPRVLRSRPGTVPVCDQSFDIDASGVVTPPGKDLVIPYRKIFDSPHPNEVDIIISSSELSKLALHVLPKA